MGAPQVTLVVKKTPAMQETQEMALESLDQEDPLRVGSGKPLQYPCLKTPMDRGAWWAIVHRVTESETTEHIGRLSPNPHTRSFYYIYIYIYEQQFHSDFSFSLQTYCPCHTHDCSVSVSVLSFRKGDLGHRKVTYSINGSIDQNYLN